MGSREKMAQFSKTQADQVALRNKSSAYSRINALLDPDSYVSLDSHVVSDQPAEGVARLPVAGDGVWTGYGTLDNRLVYLAAQDPSVYGGSMGKHHAAKITKVIDLACASGVPFIGLYESGGIRLEEGLSALEAVSDVLAALTAASGEIPLIAAVYGPCAGSAALMAGLSDLTILCAAQGALTVNGPGVLAAIANKPLTPVDLGGVTVQADQTGLVSLTAASIEAMPGIIQQLFAYLPDTGEGFQFENASHDDPNRCESLLDDMAMELDQDLDVKAMVNLIVDQGTFFELRASYAAPLLTGFARLDGQVIGIIAVSSVRLTAAMADKATRLTQLCDRLGLPIVTFLNTEGFELSAASEKEGLLGAVSRLYAAGSQARIPRIAVLLGQAIGPAYVTLASKGGGTDLILAWPTAEVSATTADTAAHILYRDEIASAQDPISARHELAERFATTVASPTAAAASGWVDEIIAPSATRPRLISSLNLLT